MKICGLKRNNDPKNSLLFIQIVFVALYSAIDISSTFRDSNIVPLNPSICPHCPTKHNSTADSIVSDRLYLKGELITQTKFKL